jgi:hypothetical protein
MMGHLPGDWRDATLLGRMETDAGQRVGGASGAEPFLADEATRFRT